MSHHGKHWAGAHVLDKAREEWLVRQLLVVVAQKILGWLQMRCVFLYEDYIHRHLILTL